MALMYDSVTGNAIPLNVAIVAGYIDGPYGPADPYGTGWSAAAWARYPNAYHVTITVKGTPGARAIDCETGDVTVAQAVTWARNEIAAGRRPTIYAAAATWSETLDAALSKAGLARGRNIDGWQAHTGVAPIVPSGFVALQYLQDQPGVNGHNVDISITDGVWPYAAPTPAPVPTSEGDMIASTPSGNGYWVVESNGSVYTYGDANYYGGCNPGASSPMPTGHLATGFAPHPTGTGYWISTNFNEVYSFGAAQYHGAPNVTGGSDGTGADSEEA